MIENTSETSNEQGQAYVEVGEELRKTRIESGLSIHDVSRQLHLSGMLIDDLEQGRTERLSPLYRRGYIANYARVLDLDPEALLSRLAQDEPPELREVLPVDRQGWKFERYLKVATYVLVTTVIVPPLVYFFIEGGSRIMERDPATSNPAVAAEESIVAEPTATQAGHGQGRNRIARALSLDESDGSREAGEMGHVAASALPLASARGSRDSISAERQSQEELLLPAMELVETEYAGNLDGFVELTIELIEDSWVEIHDAAGQRLEYDLLRAGQELRYQGEAPFQLLLGRASAVEVRINDERVIYEGHDRNDVARFRLLAEGQVER
jgi:cytoskeleton protein RodZ